MTMTHRPLRTRSSTPPVEPTASTPQAIPGWVATIVGLGALLTTAGAVIAIADPAMLLGAGEHVTDAVRVYAGYLFSRNLVLAVVLIVTLMMRARRMLAGLMVLTAAIQALDVVVDTVTGRWILVPGLVVFTVAFLLGARRLVDQPLWRPATWRDTSTPPRSPRP